MEQVVKQDDAGEARTFSSEAAALEHISDARLKAEIRRFDARGLLAEGDGRQVLKLTEPTPGAQVPPLVPDPEQPALVQATMDAAGNVRMEFRMSPEDRAMARQAQQDMARQHASALRSPVGLRGLFPTNKVRLAVKQRPSPATVQETQQ